MQIQASVHVLHQAAGRFHGCALIQPDLQQTTVSCSFSLLAGVKCRRHQLSKSDVGIKAIQ